MGLLNETQKNYYRGTNHGNYQFTSLNDIINQFLVVYVGEGKAISKASRLDVAFHAQRAMQELSFDTFKSVKTQEIELPPSLKMMLPHDYVNYVKLTFSDSSGIEHIIYPTSKTSNPFKVPQNADGSYNFAATLSGTIPNANFDDPLLGTTGNPDDGWLHSEITSIALSRVDIIDTNNSELRFVHGSENHTGAGAGVASNVYCVWQRINVTGMDLINISADGLSSSASTNVKDAGIIRFGISLREPSSTTSISTFDITNTNPNSPFNQTADPYQVYTAQTSTGQPAFAEFNDGNETFSTKSINDINVTDALEDPNTGEKYVWFVITSFVPNYTVLYTTASPNESVNRLDNITFSFLGEIDNLIPEGDSTTWTNFKSHKPSENNINDYQDYQNHIYWPNEGERYGLDPQHAQVNGSFYIDERKGMIHFSSILSGKTIILEYISDGLGTDQEMKVHKFAEEAMYKSIAHAIISASSYGQNLVRRYKKEKFAAIRQAKLRLSNIKLEEITQIFRGKSKQIKH